MKFNSIRQITVILLLFISNIYGQSGCNFTKADYNLALCINNYSGYNSSVRAQKIVSKVLRTVGIPYSNFIVKTCDDTNNATALVWKDKRYIILDEHYLESISKDGINWFYLFVISHEIGHHLYGHVFEHTTLEETRLQELQADRFAGLVIRKFGGNLDNIKNALQSIPHPLVNNSSHPIFSDRLNAANLGYNTAIKEENDLLSQYNLITSKDYIYFNKAKEIEKARNKSSDFSISRSNKELQEAINLYEIAIKDFDDPTLFFELSSLYQFTGDLNVAETYIKKAFEFQKSPEFLILGWDLCNSIKGKNCYGYQQKIRAIESRNIKDPYILKRLAIYYGQIINDNIDIENQKESQRLLIQAKNILESRTNLDEDYQLILADIYSDIAVSNLRQDNYTEAYSNILKAISNREILKTPKSDTSYSNEIDKLNYSHLYYNKALIELRLEMWEKCINSANKLYEINPGYENIINGDYNYFKARSYHNLRNYKEAILQYGEAVRLSKNNSGYLYYYRGMSYLALKNIENACSDFKKGCDGGIEPSCNRFKNLCIN